MIQRPTPTLWFAVITLEVLVISIGFVYSVAMFLLTGHW